MREESILSQVEYAPGPDSDRHQCGILITQVGHEPAVVIRLGRAPGENGEFTQEGQLTVTTTLSVIDVGAAIEALEIAMDSLHKVQGDDVEGVTTIMSNFPNDKD